MAGTPRITLSGPAPVGWTRKIYDDPIMCPGSLVLVDHNLSNLSSVPMTGGFATNIAYKTAAKIVGGDATSLRCPVTITSMTGVTLELSAKKGIHGIVSQTAQTGFWSLRVPDLVRGHIYNNPNHRYFVSLWGRVTRIAKSSTCPFLDGISNSSPVNNYMFRMLQAGTAQAGTGNFFRNAVDVVGGVQNLGNFIRNCTHNAWAGTPAPLVANFFYEVGHFGARVGDGTTPAMGPSVVDYRSYVEDLDLSGRTYAQVDTIDFGLYNKAFAVGGRLYGDTTPSNPNVVYPNP